MDHGVTDPSVDREIDRTPTPNLDLKREGLGLIPSDLIDRFATLLNMKGIVIEGIQANVKILDIIPTYVLQFNLNDMGSFPKILGRQFIIKRIFTRHSTYFLSSSYHVSNESFFTNIVNQEVNPVIQRRINVRQHLCHRIQSISQY